MRGSYVVLALIVLLVLAGGIYFLTPSNGSTSPAQEGSATSTTAAFNVVVQDRKVVSGPTVLTVKQGDAVSITITADESDEMHLHGYNLHVDFATGTPATLSFVANQSGRFTYEMETSSTQLGELDVQP